LRTSYCASKFAVNGFFDALHMEEGDDISITMFNSHSIIGTNFRANSLSGSIPTTTSKHALTVKEAA